MDARLVQGLHDYLVGSLPLGWRMLGLLVGFHGDKAKGIRTIQDVAAHGTLNRVEAEIFLCALYRRERKPREAIPLLDDLLRRFPRNFLLRFEQAEMYGALGDKTQGAGRDGKGSRAEEEAVRRATRACRGRRSGTRWEISSSGTTISRRRWRI